MAWKDKRKGEVLKSPQQLEREAYEAKRAALAKENSGWGALIRAEKNWIGKTAHLPGRKGGGGKGGFLGSQFAEELEDAAKIGIGTNQNVVLEQLAVEGLGIDKSTIPGQEKFEEEFGLEPTTFEIGQATGAVPSNYEIRGMEEQARAQAQEAQAQNALAEASRREKESYEDWQRRFAKGRNKALAERLAKLRKGGASATGRSLLTDGMDFTPGTSSGLGPSFSL